MIDQLEKLYEKFLHRPSGDLYLDLTQQILSEDSHIRNHEDWHALQNMVRLTDYQGMVREAANFIPAWLLSPRFHQLLADSASHLGDEELVELEDFQMRQCLAGLMNTGDGTSSKPYRIAHTSDLYDVLAARELNARAQHQVQHAEFIGDLITCDGGTELWFRPVLQPTTPYQNVVMEQKLMRIP